MHKRIFFIFSILSVLMTSCKTSSKSEMIELASKNIIAYKTELDEIINWIHSENYPNNTYFDLLSSKDSLNIFCLDKDQPHISLDKDFTEFLIKFYHDFGIYRINLCNDRIILRSKIRNQNWNSYGFIWYEEEITSSSSRGLKVYNNKELPKEESGWFYKLNQKWYLESPKNSDLR
nr:hypothetical protein [uncultured Carboxylicivirga sp.]